MMAPNHIGYIVDGNRRWAKAHGLPDYEGHLAGYNAIKDIIFASVEAGVKYVSVYTFSSENWKRSEDEVSKLMKLTLRVFKSDLNEFVERDIRILVLGKEEGLDPKLVTAARAAEEATANLKKGTLAICFNYGGQQEIADAAAKCIEDGLQASDITPDEIEKRLYAVQVPACDVIVRTSGEQRLSNFMMWRSAYSELIFLEKNWPDMRSEDVTAIIDTYKARKRRFGG